MQDDEMRADSSPPSNFVRDDEGDECQKCDEYLAGWKRAQADYANLKKEYEKSRVEIAANANENLLYELLPAIDHFEIALQHLPDISGLPEAERVKLQNWLVGISAIKQLWEQTFKEIGLENIDTSGEFDPSKHEAVSQEEDKTKPNHAILKIIQQGWMFKNRILRPAKVIVNSIDN
ncbi:MAG: nucleotide exchange factor GrpE [Patescibacteria group bacterium]|nr:nucleotide exchange factor GrpE [Patescibacteria group bacterium]